MGSFITGITFLTGSATDIEELFPKERKTESDIEFFRARGLRQYRRQDESTAAMVTSVLAQTFNSSKIAPDRVGAVVLDCDNWHCSREDETQILESLFRVGIRSVPILGLSLQTCSGCTTALALADKLLRCDPDARPVLVLVCGRAKPSASRVDTLRATILSDGVASCIVSNIRLGLELLAHHSHFNLAAVRANAAGERPINSILQSQTQLAQVAHSLFAKASLKGADIDTCFCTNGSIMYTDLAAHAAGIPRARAYKDNIGSFGHIFSCDNLIGLSTYAAKHGFKVGEKYLLLGWAPYAFSGAIVAPVDN